MAKDFNQAAAQWDEEPRRIALAEAIASAMRVELPLHSQTHLLDIGAGTGLISLRLRPDIGALTAIDTSPGMLAQLSQKAEKMGAKVTTEVWDLLASPYPTQQFDAAISAMVLHHIRDTALFFQRVHALLHPGGVFAIADLCTEDGTFHEEMDGVYHTGFDPQHLGALLSQNGFHSPRHGIVHVIQKAKDYPVFLLCATRDR